MTIVLTILVAILIFGLVIFIHELGHFIVAKRSGIKVNEFALGMGPRILKFGKGETTYSWRLFPIGGFVSMEGEDEESDDDRSFQKAPIWKRMLVIVAGAFMNLVLGFLATVLLISLGQDVIVGRTVGEVTWEGSGLQVGDTIEKINGRSMFVYSDLDYEFARTQNGTFDIEVTRDGQRVVLTGVTFNTMTMENPETGELYMNDATGEPYEWLDKGFRVYPEEKTFFSVLKESFNTTLSYGRLIYLTLFDLITGKVAINNLSGPVGIVSQISQAVSIGWQPVVQLLALISINLGIMNMLPLPALDGGKFLLLIIEAIRRKPLKAKVEIGINIAGFVLLIGLMVVVSFNDILRLVR